MRPSFHSNNTTSFAQSINIRKSIIKNSKRCHLNTTSTAALFQYENTSLLAQLHAIKRTQSQTKSEPRFPVAPTGPIGPTGPVCPVCPREPVDPVAPLVPRGPVAPVGPGKPDAPVTPVIPTGPVTPVNPVYPICPVSPGAPCNTIKTTLIQGTPRCYSHHSGIFCSLYFLIGANSSCAVS